MQDGSQAHVLAQSEGARQALLVDKQLRTRVRGKGISVHTGSALEFFADCFPSGASPRSPVIICENKKDFLLKA